MTRALGALGLAFLVLLGITRLWNPGGERRAGAGGGLGESSLPSARRTPLAHPTLVAPALEVDPGVRQAMTGDDAARPEPAAERALDDATLVFKVSEPATGHRLSEVDLWIKSAGDEGRAFLENGLTDAEGQARFHVPAGMTLNLEVRASWRTLHEGLLGRFEAGEVREVPLDLPLGYTRRFVGQVVAAESGAPIARARIRHPDRAVKAGIFGRSLGRTTFFELETDEQGRFELYLHERRASGVRVTARGRADALVNLAGSTLPGEARIFGLRAPARLDVQLNALPGRAVEDAVVEWTVDSEDLVLDDGGLPRGFTRAYRFSARPDAGGVCRFEGLPPTTIRGTVTVKGESFEFDQDLSLAPDEHRVVGAWTDGRLELP